METITASGYEITLGPEACRMDCVGFVQQLLPSLPAIDALVSYHARDISHCIIKLDCSRNIIALDLIGSRGLSFKLLTDARGQWNGRFGLTVEGRGSIIFGNEDLDATVSRKLGLEFMILQDLVLRPDLVIQGKGAIAELLTSEKVRKNLFALQEAELVGRNIQRIEVKTITTQIGSAGSDVVTFLTVYAANEICLIDGYGDGTYRLANSEGLVRTLVVGEDNLVSSVRSLCRSLGMRADIAKRGY